MTNKISEEERKKRHAARQRAYYKANKEKVSARRKAYRKANKEKEAAWRKAYREANKEKVAAQQKSYREANKEKVAAQQKAYYEANKEKLAACQKAYYEANKEKLAAYQKAYRETRSGRCVTLVRLAKRRAKKQGVKCSLTYTEVPKYCEVTGLPFVMELAGTPHPFGPSLDRIVPGGDYTDENTRWVCNAFNWIRSSNSDDDLVIQSILEMADHIRLKLQALAA